jgi:hypothetical protein
MKRDQRIIVYLNGDELRRLEQLASASGLRLSEYLRTQALDMPGRLALQRKCDRIRRELERAP